MKDQITNANTVAIIRKNGGGKAKRRFLLSGIEDVILCNNEGISDCEDVMTLNDVIKSMNMSYEHFTVFILLPIHYHYQILQQLNREIEDFSRIQIKYESDLNYIWTKTVKEREDIFDYSVVYSDFIDRWTNNLMSEVHFWEFESLTEGHRCFGEALERNKKEFFECNRIELFEGCKVLDLGCGCLYKWGNVLNNGDYIPMDPLAHFYNHLYKNWKYANDLRKETVFGLFEFASAFCSEKVDYVLIDNAIDHCIDPVKAIVEALKCLKIDGILSIYTYEDESINAMETGLHNWNLSLNSDNELIIWNIDNFANITKFLEDYVEYKVVEDDTWFHPAVGEHRTFAVNIKKKKELPENFYAGKIEDLTIVLSSIMRLMTTENYYKDLKKVIDFKNQ